MCQFKSGIILRNKVVLTPEGNESHSDLLESLGIADTHMNASKTFVRAELIPKDNDKTSDVKDWRYKVDQDIVPDWYEKDPERYEQEFRNAVEKCMEERKKNFKFGVIWNNFREESSICSLWYLNVNRNSPFFQIIHTEGIFEQSGTKELRMNICPMPSCVP